MTNEERIAALERELAELKAKVSPPKSDFVPLSAAEHFDQMHQARECAANNFRFSPEIQREMNKACGTADLQDLVHASRRPQGPSVEAIPSSQTLISGRRGGMAGDGTGWKPQRDWGANGQHPTPDIRNVDAVAEGFARREKGG